MKKKILSIALVMAALCGMPAMAQNQNTSKGTCTKSEKSDSTTCCNRTKGERPARNRNPYKEIFAGLNLTPEQQTALDALRLARPERGQRRDSTATRPDPKQSYRDYLKGVKQILTPEQYVVFLENVVVEQSAPNGKGPRHDMRQNRRTDRSQIRSQRRDDRKDRKEARAERQNRPARDQQSQK